MAKRHMGIDIKWSAPYEVRDSGKLCWRRKWEIPSSLMEGFLVFWNKKKIHMIVDGYSIEKSPSGKSTLIQTKNRQSEFGEGGRRKKSVDKDTRGSIASGILKEISELNSCDISGLREWQIPSVKKLAAIIKENGAAINGSETGTGKSYSSVAVARALGMKIAVVCPKVVISSWKKIINDHFKMDYVFVLNYEAVKTGNHKSVGVWERSSTISLATEFKWKIPKDTLIVFDESHKMKGADSINSEIGIAAKDQGYKILCCSATSAINPLELKAIGYILGLYKKGKWTAFRSLYGCEKGRFGWEFTGGATVLKELNHNMFKCRGIRITKNEIASFPDCETFSLACDLDAEVKNRLDAIYSMLGEEIRKLKEKIGPTKKAKLNAMTAQLRARQKAELIKVPIFVDMAEEEVENGNSVAIFCNFSDTIKALTRKLKTNCIIWGDNTDEERNKNIDAFQSDKARIILVNSQAGGAGVSLHDLNGNYPRVALISPPLSAVIMKQVLGRIHRDGAKSKAIQKLIFAANTEEERVCISLREKLHNMDMINDGDLMAGPSF